MAGLTRTSFFLNDSPFLFFFTNNFAGSLTQKIGKYARAFEKLTDKMAVDGLPLIVRSVGTVIAIYFYFLNMLIF